MSNITMPELFAGVTDPRKKNVTHPLINILTIAFTAVLCGANDWVTIALFGESKRKFFEKLLDLSAGIPAHYTFSDIFNRLNPVELSSVLARWAEALSTEAEKHLAIDGKTMRRAWDKSAGCLTSITFAGSSNCRWTRRRQTAACIECMGRDEWCVFWAPPSGRQEQ